MKKIAWNIRFIFLIILLAAGSCIKNDVLDNVVLDQALSLPLGEKEFKVEAGNFVITNNSTSPNVFWYNGKPFWKPLNYFSYDGQIDFNLDSINKSSFIQRVDLKFRIINSYPLVSYFQLFLLDANGVILDKVFVNNNKDVVDDILGLKCLAGEIDSQNEPDILSTTIPEAVIFDGERLEKLKQTKILSYKINMLTSREDSKVVKFSHNCNMKINVAMRLFLNYNLNEL